MLNEKLSRIHKIVLIPYVLIWLMLGLPSLLSKDSDGLHPALFFTALFILPILAHGFAMVGAKKGKNWGRTLSKVVGVLCLFGFPFWTILGVYILKQTGKKWESETAS